jgi:PH/SEC7 domain-containing protein
MSRNQFVRNTLSAIQMQLHPNGNGSNSDFDSSSGRQGSDYLGSSPARMVKRSDSMTSWSSLSKDAASGLPQTLSPHVNGSTGSFQAVSNDQKENGGVTPLYDRNWESEMETVLKVSLATLRSLVPRLSRIVGHVCGHQKPAGVATSGCFRTNIHFFPLASWDVDAQSQYSRTT